MTSQSERGTIQKPAAIELSAEHHNAVNRRRRIVVQYDPNLRVGLDLTQRTEEKPPDSVGDEAVRMVGHSMQTGQSVFAYEDDPETQIDAIYWDMGGPSTLATWKSKILAPFRHQALQMWWDKGLDMVKALVDATRERGMEAFWNFRISEADFLPEGGDVPELVPMKKDHPDWIIKGIHWYGEWNYAVPEVREFNLKVLRELAENYEFDGFQIDFSRHVPVLPPGEEWSFRDSLTDFMRKVRLMTLEVERKRGRPFLVAAKVPRNLEGCRADGIDVEAWAEQDLVDILTLGCRSMDVDIAAFRRITSGRNIKLQPCLDTHHATAGYKWPPVEFFRGVFGNWWQQGADSVLTFNWSAALQPEKGMFPDRYWGTRVELQAYKEVGSPETLAHKNKFFAVERRGGFPWSGGFFCRNDTAPLPVTLANHGRPASLTIRICDNLRASADRLANVTLRVVLFGAREGDQIEVRFNGAALQPVLQDHDWKDRQIHTPNPQPNTCGLIIPEVDPNQKLLRMDYALPPGLCKPGENEVGVRILDRIPYNTGQDIHLEKVEVHVDYK